MSTNSKISHLRLVYPPISNQEAYWLRSDPAVEERLRQSDFYLIGGRREAEFKDLEIDRDRWLVTFRICLKDGPCDAGTLDLKRLPGIEASESESIEIELGPKLIRVWDRDRSQADANVLEWFTTDTMLYERSHGRPGVLGLDNARELSTFYLYYAGIAKAGDSFDRVIKNGHARRTDILANEKQRHPSSRVADETFLFLFSLKTWGAQVFDIDDDFEDFGLVAALDPKNIVADAEKAFVKLLDPQYNLKKYHGYPHGVDGLHDSGLTRYGYVLGEDLTFVTSTSTIKGAYGEPHGFSNEADCIFVEGDTVSLRISGKDFPSE